MAQNITTRYRDFDTSEVQNQRFVNVVETGVYSGYDLSVNGGLAFTLDITTGESGMSTLVTSEGVVVTETDTVAAAVKLANADPSFDRIDLIVAEYQYTTNPADVQTYKVLRGPAQAGSGEPEVPVLQNAYQVPLGQVYVRAGANYILQSDVRPAVKANWTVSTEWGDLRAEVASGNSSILYVYPGTFGKSDASEVLQFPGGYSTVITDGTFQDGETRWYLFGVSDGLQVVSAGWAPTEAELSDAATDVLVVAKVKATKANGVVTLSNVVDLRVPFARAGFRPDEAIKYQELLGNSVLRYLRVEEFEDLDGIEANSIDGGTITLNTAGSSAEIAANAAAGNDVTFVSTDRVYGSRISTVDHFMVVADSTIENLTFTYSTVSPTTGFTTQQFRPGELVRVPGGTARRLYIKFLVPSAEFFNGATTRMFSYGVLMNLDNSGKSALSISELGIGDLTESVPNLIANGDFYFWTKGTVQGKPVEPASTSLAYFPVSSESPYLADGWQFTKINASLGSSSVGRTTITGVDGTSTALYLDLQPDTSAAEGAPTVMEYRIPRAAALTGNRLTFAADFSVENGGSVTIGIAQFQRTSAGLVRIASDSRTVVRAIGTTAVTTQAGISADADVVSFFMTFQNTVTGTIRHARAAVGEFGILPNTYVSDAEAVLGAYAERGTFFLTGFAEEGGVFGGSVQFGVPKRTELGLLEAGSTNSATAAQTTNADNVTFSADRFGVIVSATAGASANISLQADWQAFVKYEGSAQ